MSSKPVSDSCRGGSDQALRARAGHDKSLQHWSVLTHTLRIYAAGRKGSGGAEHGSSLSGLSELEPRTSSHRLYPHALVPKTILLPFTIRP